MTRSLALRKETLTDLTPADLALVNGGSFTIDGYPTWICTPLIIAVSNAVKDGVTRLSVVECPA